MEWKTFTLFNGNIHAKRTVIFQDFLATPKVTENLAKYTQKYMIHNKTIDPLSPSPSEALRFI